VQTELSFLLELLLEHKLPKDTRSAVAVRIKDVELGIHTAIPIIPATRALAQGRPIPANAEAQALAASLSAQANAEIQGSRIATVLSERSAKPEPIPAQAVGITSAAAEAMATRNKLIAEAQAGIAKKGPAVGRGHGTK
jgi:hypothetical protein